MANVVIVNEAYADNQLLLQSASRRALPVHVVDSGALVEGWASVLAVDAGSGGSDPTLSAGDTLRIVAGGSGGVATVSAPGTDLEVVAPDGAGTLVLSGGPGTSSGDVRIRTGDRTTGGFGVIYCENGLGDVIFRVDGEDGYAFGAGNPAWSPPVIGARGGNAALTSLLAVLANMGLITDNTT